MLLPEPRLSFSRPRTAALLWLAAALWPLWSSAESDRDFYFIDGDGHLIMRFAGSGGADLTPNQEDERVDSEFSVMVHDRLRADILFEAEPVDETWSAVVTPRLEAQLQLIAPDFSMIDVECRSASCRAILEHSRRRTIYEHQSLMEEVQSALRGFIDQNETGFMPVFMITAYDQSDQTPHIKAFLERQPTTP